MTGVLSNLKYYVFFAVLLIGVPTSYYLSLKFAFVEKTVFFLMVFFTVQMQDINFVSRETFRLTSKGFEVGMVDIATIVILLIVLNRKKQFPIHLPPGSYIYFVYFALSVLSIINSNVVIFSFFELWKMIRMFVYFFVIYNYINNYKQFNDLMRGIAIIIIYIFYQVMQQKYLQGKFQTAGPFPHQNSLVMYSIILGSLVFAYLLNKKNVKFVKFLVWLILLGMNSVVVISTLSRAGMVLYAASISIILYLSFASGFSVKKIGVMFLLLILSTAVLFRAWDSITERFKTAPEESANVRKELAVAALKMVKDKPLGIGLNNFGIKINPPWQYSNHIEMHNADDPDEKNGLVETIYLMIAAECGWHTLFVFLCFLMYFFVLNIQNYFRYRNTDYQFFSIAMIGGLLAIYIESSLEWVLKQTNNFYQLMLVFALIAVLRKLSKTMCSTATLTNQNAKQRLNLNYR